MWTDGRTTGRTDGGTNRPYFIGPFRPRPGSKKTTGNFETLIKLKKEVILDLQWWIKKLHTVSKKLQYPNITKVIYTDASMHGWGHTVKECQQEDHGLIQKRIGI